MNKVEKYPEKDPGADCGNWFDIFISYRHKHKERVSGLTSLLEERGLKVWWDSSEVGMFERIPEAIDAGLGKSKALLCWYSADYSKSRSCQYEFTKAYLAARRCREEDRRILILNPEPSDTHIPKLFRRARYLQLEEGEEGLVSCADNLIAIGGVRALRRTFEELAGSLEVWRPPRFFPRRLNSAPYFKDRFGALWKIDAALHPSPPLGERLGTGLVQLVGMGGSGKSLLAEEYALRFECQYPGGVFWLDAGGSRGSMEWQAASIAAYVLDKDSEKELKPPELTAALWKRLGENQREYLWIVDNIPETWDFQQFQEVLPKDSRYSKVLFTSRSLKFNKMSAIVDIEQLEPEDGFELLTRALEPGCPSERDAAYEIVKEVGGHSMALDLISAVIPIVSDPRPYTRYLDRLKSPSMDVLELAAQLDEVLPNGHEKSIAATLKSSIEKLGNEARYILELAAMAETVPIPQSLIAGVLVNVIRRSIGTGAGSTRDSTDTLIATRIEPGLHQLRNASLAQCSRMQGQEPHWIVHPLVSRTVSQTPEFQEHKPMLEEALVAYLKGEVPEIYSASGLFKLVFLLPHAELAARRLLERGKRWREGPFDLEGLLLPRKIGLFYDTAGKPEDAIPFIKSIVAVRDRVQGKNAPEALAAKADLARVFIAAGRDAKAKALLRRELRRRESEFGATHPYTLDAKHCHAQTLYRLGDYQGAKTFAEESWQGRKRRLGEGHADTLGSLLVLEDACKRLGLDGRVKELSAERTRLLENVSSEQQVRWLRHPVMANRHERPQREEGIFVKNLLDNILSSLQEKPGISDRLTPEIKGVWVRSLNGIKAGIARLKAGRKP
jgi:hypothetical protein